jgi:transposase
MQVHSVGIDIAKTVFHLVALDEQGTVVIKRRFSRSQLLRFTGNLAAKVMGMEACSGAHYLARALMEQGHEVRLMPAEYVKPYVKSNKNDFVDAEAIAEAVVRPTMRFVALKTDAQLDMQALHRVRSRWVSRRTSLINQIRGFLLERGIPIRTGAEHLRKNLPAGQALGCNIPPLRGCADEGAGWRARAPTPHDLTPASAPPQKARLADRAQSDSSYLLHRRRRTPGRRLFRNKFRTYLKSRRP